MAFEDVVRSVKNEAANAVDITKQKMKISKEKASIRAKYEEIGKYYYKKYEETSEADEGVISLINDISASKQIINDCNLEIDRIKSV